MKAMHEHEEAWAHGPGPHARGRARKRGWGPPPDFMMRGSPFGFGGPRGGPFGPKFARGPRVRRGDVRAAALSLLAEGPRNGYQIIQEISGRTEGVWRPSPGSVYPALQQLEDEGLIRPETGEGGRRAYRLTEEGEAYAQAHAEELRESWDAVTESVDDAEIELREIIRGLMMAVMQVARAGSAAQVAQAATVLTDTRRALYRILAADDEDGGESGKNAG